MRGDKSSKWSLRHGQTSAAFSVIPARGQSFLHWLIEKRVYRDINKDSVYRISIQIINHLANLWPPKLLLFGEVLPSTLAHSFASVALDWLPEFSLGKRHFGCAQISQSPSFGLHNFKEIQNNDGLLMRHCGSHDNQR